MESEGHAHRAVGARSARYRRLAVFGFFVAYLLVGVSVFDDYGLSWDERENREIGAVNARYLAGDDALLGHKWRHYGVGFELPMFGIERLVGVEDPREIFLLRHLVTFLLFCFGVYFFYRLCRDCFGSWQAGLLGAALLISSPRIFAHSFYNPKDLPFLSLFVVSAFTLHRFLVHRDLRAAAWHALASAVLIDIRIVGLIVPALTLGFAALEVVSDRSALRKFAGGLACYALLTAALVVALWPILWGDPIHRFAFAFRLMSDFPFGGSVLYFGERVAAADVPWHYVPGWIAVTTPPLQLVSFVLGLIVCGHAVFARGYPRARWDCLLLAWLLVPMIAVVSLDSTLYGGWRHLFFVYPALVAISLRGIVFLWDRFGARGAMGGSAWPRAALASIVAVGMLATAIYMARSHPHQNVYFNLLAGRDIRHRFGLDMWGLSFRQALEYILRNDSAPVLNVMVSSRPGIDNALILEPRERRRIRFVDDLRDADYFIGNFRNHPNDYPFGDEVHAIRVGGTKIVVIHRP